MIYKLAFIELLFVQGTSAFFFSSRLFLMLYIGLVFFAPLRFIFFFPPFPFFLFISVVPASQSNRPLLRSSDTAQGSFLLLLATSPYL